jgi:hypothetical protein
MIAHVGGVPVEELVPLALAGGALWAAALVSMRARVARLLQARRAARPSR